LPLHFFATIRSKIAGGNKSELINFKNLVMSNWVKYKNNFPKNLDLIASFSYGAGGVSVNFFSSSGSVSSWFCGNEDKCLEVGQ